jgi:hypothetical protein
MEPSSLAQTFADTLDLARTGLKKINPGRNLSRLIAGSNIQPRGKVQA